MIDGKTQLYGLLAHPAHHSRSPRMHNLSFDHWNINARYLAFDVAPGDLAAAIGGMRSLGIAGVNLSMPFKQTVIPLLDDLTPRAQRINAVNTIKNDQGRLIGDSTDGAGLFQSLQSREFDLRGQRVVILGAGGAGKAIIAAALDYQLARVDVFKRQTPSYASVANWVADLAPTGATPLQLHPYEDVTTMHDLVAQADLVINATSVGMTTAGLPVPTDVLAVLHPGQVVYDVIYHPLETAFLARAREAGCTTHNGLGMLIGQGALAFQFWTGKPMPVAAVEADLLASLAPTSK
ncbi:shikimate dehydrogenase [Levilactobacillus zymae]|uniref:shikimate dehydrogenase n=1 Tax=Levilactobacillus zymae TaxID=267363 RepID=UPI0028B6AF38|nr:shikimate dehydrogenase [Levilactobacillus zymae]MDT6980240.1 shikimate dehydrogenase [Levilactobacillus zymae]